MPKATSRTATKPRAKTKAKAEAAAAEEDIVYRLFAVIESRRGGDPEVSNTARLFARGSARIAQRMGEEAVELAIEAVREDRDGVIGESVDVLYHLLVLWADAGVTPDEVFRELERREGISGIAEKKVRANDLGQGKG